MRPLRVECLADHTSSRINKTKMSISFFFYTRFAKASTLYHSVFILHRNTKVGSRRVVTCLNYKNFLHLFVPSKTLDKA